MKLFSSRGTKVASHKHVKKNNRGPLSKALLIILIIALAALLTSSLVLYLRGEHAQSDFNELSSQVQENTVKPSPSHSPTPTPTPTAEASPEPSPEETPAPTPSEPPSILPQYEELYEENNDFFGWIKIDDTFIDYPVMHTPEDPEKYLHLNFKEAYSSAGTPFIDAKCSPDSDNLLIYGHSSADGKMFRGLLKYQKEDYWKEHPTITFNTLYEEQEFKILAAFRDRVYYKTEDCFKFYQFIDAENEEEFDYAISQFKEKSDYDTGVDAKYGDQLITLVTCAYHVRNGRYVVVAVKNNDTAE